ncbi:hypoxanthine phosphoribosyltransferase [Fontibacter flavus]|uniref:Hypoxanthine phosphoribosyltransferase n=1 Tax=Fontibacter flavus TaxID=654838 RepID=A0ABV6FUF6_9BACT
MVEIKDKTFVPFLERDKIQERVNELGKEISKDYAGKQPVILGILNGAFMFLSDLAKQITISSELSFIKISSYSGESSTGKVSQMIGLETNLINRHVIVVEDIVDTGLSMKHLVELIKEKNPASLAVATLLHKPEAIKHPIKLDYVGFNIPNKFVVGYGLDYDGLGRNLPEIYQLKT